jgi:hypothetical protein
MATFHVLSDLHLEMFPGFRLDPAQVTEPNLILAGDIADPSADEYRCSWVTAPSCLSVSL